MDEDNASNGIGDGSAFNKQGSSLEGHVKWQANPSALTMHNGLEKEQALLEGKGPVTTNLPPTMDSGISDQSTLTSGGDTLTFSCSVLEQ